MRIAIGRELKRVSLNFDWPLNKTWEGFINPYGDQFRSCSGCSGTGFSKEYRNLTDKWYGKSVFRPEDRGSVPFTVDNPTIQSIAKRIVSCDAKAAAFYRGFYQGDPAKDHASYLCGLYNRAWSHHLNEQDVKALIEGGRLCDFTSAWTPGEGWKLKDPPYVPTPEEVNLWSLSGMGHDAVNSHIVVSAECNRLGFGIECQVCNGKAGFWPSPEIEKLHEEWEKQEPPEGDGYQIWENVSEGSPISPVFDTPEKLAQWMVRGAAAERDEGVTEEEWLEFIRGPKLSPSLVIVNGAVMNGVKAVVAKDGECP